MRKQFIYCNLLLLVGTECFSFGSLGEISTQALFKKETWNQLKPKIVDQLNHNGAEFKQALRLNGLKIKKLDMSNMLLNDLTFKGIKIKKKGETKTKRGKIKKCVFKGSDFTDTVFERQNFENIDFSGMDLKNARFIKCKFINCSFEGSDLRKVIFENSIFKAKYRYSRSGQYYRLHEALLCDNLVFDDNKSEALIYDYSHWMKKSKELRKINPKLADRYYNKTIGLNKVLGCLCLKLDNTDLSSLDLSEINLSNSKLSDVNFDNTNLTNAILNNAWLRECCLTNAILLNIKLKKTRLPDVYLDRAILSETLRFPKKSNMTEEDKKIYGNLFYSFYWFDYHSDYKNSVKIEWDHKDLHNTDLCEFDLAGKDLSCFKLRSSRLPENLQGTNFTGADLRNANLEGSDLTNAILIDAKLKGIILNYVSGVYLSGTVRVPEYSYKDCSPLLDKLLNGTGEEKILYQKLLNLKVRFIRGVPKSELIKLTQQVKNLKNTDLSDIDLESLNLSGIQLKNSYLINAILNGTNFEKANLKKACLNGADLNGANLKGANLKGASMQSVDLRKANLRGAKLQGVNLSGALLSDQYRLPDNCTDNTLTNCYQYCKDKEEKFMLTQILVGKKLFPKILLKIKREELIIEEPPAKRIKIE